MERIRKPAVAGYFYPGDPQSLKNEIGIMLASSQLQKTFKNIIGIVSPHAGYVYSGRTAAYAFNSLKGKNISDVIIISPSHREYFPGICIYEGDMYETPLGPIKVNHDMADKICESSKIIFRGVKGHGDEHAIEVQLPFLQSVIDNFRIVPVVMGDQGKLFVNELAEKISVAANKNTLIIASSDLSHYYDRTKANKLDSIVEKNISDFDYNSLLANIDGARCEACGGGSIAAMMKAADLMNYKKSEVLFRNDSGDASGDTNQVVGYLSAVVYGD